MKAFLDIFRSFDPAAFHFLRPGALWLFAAMAVVVTLYLLGNREQKRWRHILPAALRPYMFSKGNPSAVAWPLTLLAVGLSLMILALAGPTWKKRDIPAEKIPSVVMICLDLSRSMDATDIQPSRLERAKMKVSDFLDANPRARTGLIAYAGTPHAVLPFTPDYKLIKHQAQSLHSWAMPVPGTDVPLMLTLIDTMMLRIEAPSTIVLMTDAIDDAQATALSSWIDNTPHRMEILLFSTPAGATVPGMKDIVSVQSAATLSNLQQNPKITATYITLDHSDVEAVAKRISDHLIFQKDNKDKSQDWDDMGWLLLVPALVIALLWFRRGWMVQWCVAGVLLTAFTGCGPEARHAAWWYTDDYRAQALYDKGNYAGSEKLFTDPAHRAAAYYRAGDFLSAAELLATDSTATGEYNYGLALASMGYYDQAAEAFQKAAAADPALAQRAQQNIDASKLMKDQAQSVLQFKPLPAPLDSILKKTVKTPLHERKPKSEDDQLTSDTEVKKLPTTGDRTSDEVASNIHRAREQRFPPKDFSLGEQPPTETQVLMQKTNADPGEFLHRRFEIQKQKYYPDTKPSRETW